jgi:pyruvate,orthophosphate dikinase
MATLYMTASISKAASPANNSGSGSGSASGLRQVSFSHDDATNYGQGRMTPALVPFGGSAPRVPKPDKQVLGGKGMGLQEMSNIGISVPPGFTLTAPLCPMYQQTGDLPQPVWDEVEVAIARVERDVGRKFGDASHPLLFSCRSGAAISMPGMMDTVLNIVRKAERNDGVCVNSLPLTFTRFLLLSPVPSGRA